MGGTLDPPPTSADDISLIFVVRVREARGVASFKRDPISRRIRRKRFHHELEAPRRVTGQTKPDFVDNSKIHFVSARVSAIPAIPAIFRSGSLLAINFRVTARSNPLIFLIKVFFPRHKFPFIFFQSHKNTVYFFKKIKDFAKLSSP